MNDIGRVLIVDDHPGNRELLRDLLEGEGYATEQACDGREALRMLQADDERFDVVLLDVMMPVLDGFETCRCLRANEKIWTPVIMVTALEDVESRVEGKEAGADDFLIKPISCAELLARVKTLIVARRNLQVREARRAQVEAELERARDELMRMERLSSIANLAAGVGHELKNVAVVLSSAVSELSHAADLDPTLVDDLRVANEHVRHHASALLALGRPGPEYEDRLEVGAVVRATVDLMRKSGRTKHVTVEVDADVVHAFVNRTRVEQIVLNLVGNAADAVEGVRGRAPRIHVRVQRRADGRASIAVSDNGAGMSPEVRTRLFEPYFTTKPAGKGTGLGLYVVRRIVEGYGGTLVVESAPGAGTTFALDLPTVAASSREIAPRVALA